MNQKMRQQRILHAYPSRREAEFQFRDRAKRERDNPCLIFNMNYMTIKNDLGLLEKYIGIPYVQDAYQELTGTEWDKINIYEIYNLELLNFLRSRERS